MDFNSWDLDDSSMSWRVLKSHYEDEEEEVEDEEGVYPCPFCSEDFDVAELVEYHIQEYHIGEAPPSRSYNGFEICPVCAIRVRSDMVEHLITKHRNSLDMEQLLKLVKDEVFSGSSLYYGEQYRRSSQSASSEAEEVADKLLSFICEVPLTNEVANLQPNSPMSGNSSLESCPSEEKVERANAPSPTLAETAADKEARSRCNFVQELIFSSFFNLDL
ncbi:hypothetical protein SAY86_023133 [Trapa natans]|uniref:C2H2-type domain-containing protein n=1 Tax=Trapa natans TaxID=22666 RepID=A0AAN7M6U9_TRANT|nr:hypothetical protein SAY86_023133 [Trapa natans]